MIGNCFFPTLFNELHKVARHGIRRSPETPVEACRPRLRSNYKAWSTESEKERLSIAYRTFDAQIEVQTLLGYNFRVVRPPKSPAVGFHVVALLWVKATFC